MKQSLRFFLWLFVLIGGSYASVLYVQGFRLDPESRELVTTGILDISTNPPGALIFLDNVFSGQTPAVFRGYPLGTVTVRFEKSGFRAFETQLEVQNELVTKLENHTLVPLDPAQYEKILGTKEDIIWDPERRGYIRLLPFQQALEETDILRGTTKIREFPAPLENIQFLSNGSMKVLLTDGQSFVSDPFSRRLFSSYESLIAESLFSPRKQKLISFQQNRLFLKDIQQKSIELAMETTAPILGAWWLPDSDDILGVTDTEIFFWSSALQQQRNLLRVDNIDKAFFLPDKNQLFYKNSEMWESVIFGFK